MLRGCPHFFSFRGAVISERMIMGNIEELISAAELDELYRLSASEGGPEEDGEEEEEEEGEDKPDEIPHG
jgi:hypothetical protein